MGILQCFFQLDCWREGARPVDLPERTFATRWTSLPGFDSVLTHPHDVLSFNSPMATPVFSQEALGLLAAAGNAALQADVFLVNGVLLGLKTGGTRWHWTLQLMQWMGRGEVDQTTTPP